MNRKLWLISLGFLSFAVNAQNAQPNQENPYVANTQQLLDSSAAQAKQNLNKLYPPPVPMSGTTQSGSGAVAQPPPPPSAPTQPQPIQMPTTDNSSQQTSTQPTYQENVAVTPNTSSSPGGASNQTNIYTGSGGGSNGTSSGTGSGSSGNIYR